ncbi:MAG TPA: DMT family transporter [Geminicoccaceae bacterium]
MSARSEAASTQRSAHAHPATRTAAGIGLVILAIGLFTVMDAIGKGLMARYPVPQVVWARYFFQLSWMLLLLPRVGAGGLVRTTRLGTNIVRGLLLAFSTIFMFGAISFVPLADAYTITFIAPLLVTVFSIPMLGERVGWRRWTAVCAGFIGVLIVIRPGFGMAHWALALPLVTAVGFALYQILTRKVSGTPGETAFAMLFHLAWVGTAILTAVVPFFWQPIAPLDWLPMAAMGALGGLGHLILIRALTIAPASLLAPFVYTQIAWALLLGYLVFGDVPDRWMLVGGAVIVASGLYVFYREAVLGRA